MYELSLIQSYTLFYLNGYTICGAKECTLVMLWFKKKCVGLCFDISQEAPTRYGQNFSAGRIDGFKKYHEFKQYKSHGESGAADTLAAEAALPRLYELVNQ